MWNNLIAAVVISLSLLVGCSKEESGFEPRVAIDVVRVTELGDGRIYPGSTLKLEGCFREIDEETGLLASFSKEALTVATMVEEEDGSSHVLLVVPAIPSATYDLQLHVPGVVSNEVPIQVEYPDFIRAPDYEPGERTALVIQRTRNLTSSMRTTMVEYAADLRDPQEQAVMEAGAEIMQNLMGVLNHYEGEWAEETDLFTLELSDAYTYGRMGILAAPASAQGGDEHSRMLPPPDGGCGSLSDYMELALFYLGIATDTGLGVTETIVIPTASVVSVASAGTAAPAAETVKKVLSIVVMVGNSFLPVDLQEFEMNVEHSDDWEWESDNLTIPVELMGSWAPQRCLIYLVDDVVKMLLGQLGEAALEELRDSGGEFEEYLADMLEDLLENDMYVEELQDIASILGAAESEVEGLRSVREGVEFLVSLLLSPVSTALGDEVTDGFCSTFLHHERIMDAGFYTSLGYDTVVTLVACHLGMDAADLRAALDDTLLGRVMSAIEGLLQSVDIYCDGYEASSVKSGSCSGANAASGKLCLEIPFSTSGDNMVSQCAVQDGEERMEVDFRAWVWRPYESEATTNRFARLALDVLDATLSVLGGNLVIPHAVEGYTRIGIDSTSCIDRDGDGYVSDACGQEYDLDMVCEEHLGIEPDECDYEYDRNPCASEAGPDGKSGDGIDNNCNGIVDEGTYWFDDDGDCFCEDDDAANCLGTVNSTCTWLAGGDCDDAHPGVYPGAASTGMGDMNCDDMSYPDLDGDGYNDESYPGGTDCNDRNSSVHPGAVEIWYDGVDQDCDGWSDYDADYDGYDSDAHGGTDCDDSDPTIYPGAEEIWYDGVDQDCDGWSDYDADMDGYVSDTYGGTDCDDSDPTIYPGATEYCDGQDNNCDGTVDDSSATDATTWYRDSDGDGYGDPAYSTTACSQPGGYVSNADDCDDGDASINPEATEVCDGVDNDCNGVIDEGCGSTPDDVNTDTIYETSVEAYTISGSPATVDLWDLYFGSDTGDSYYMAASFPSTLMDDYDSSSVYVSSAQLWVRGYTVSYDTGAMLTQVSALETWHSSPSHGEEWSGVAADGPWVSEVDYDPDLSSATVEIDIAVIVQAWLDGDIAVEGFVIGNTLVGETGLVHYIHRASSTSDIALVVEFEEL